MHITFGDRIIMDAMTKKRQDMDEITADLLKPWEYHIKWRSEDEKTAHGKVGARAGIATGRERTGSASARTGCAEARTSHGRVAASVGLMWLVPS